MVIVFSIKEKEREIIMMEHTSLLGCILSSISPLFCMLILFSRTYLLASSYGLGSNPPVVLKAPTPNGA